MFWGVYYSQQQQAARGKERKGEEKKGEKTEREKRQYLNIS